jgi:nitroreductase
MDVIEAILNRYSVRDFSSQPVPKETVMKILEAAIHSPSGINGQPWEVFVAAGATLEKIRKIYQERPHNVPARQSQPGAPPRPAFILERMAALRNERMKLLGLDPNDQASGNVFTEWSRRLYGAMVLIVVCMDRGLSSNLDIGLFIQTICLAAQGYGVDSIIAQALVSHADVLRQELEIPESLNIVTGVGLGYANQSLINTYRSSRRPVQEVVRYKS